MASEMTLDGGSVRFKEAIIRRLAGHNMATVAAPRTIFTTTLMVRLRSSAACFLRFQNEIAECETQP
ncbi:MAG: hypothetical protein DME22_09535 [Verrucomicrobia bacterium]|nr:MAG: hypothetical protein DME22_09535 [Verrucomicrobiota bacterium]